MARYLIHNVYGDASALLTNTPADVVKVPMGWDTAAETSRRNILTSLGPTVSVSTLPALLYQSAGKWVEMRVSDMAKPWSWLAVNTALASTFSVALLGDSIFHQLGGSIGSMQAPFNTAQNLGVSGTTTTQIRSQVASIGAGVNRVVVEGGINNFAYNTVSQIIPDYQAIIESIPTSKQVVIVGIVPNDEAQLHISRPGDTQTNAAIAAINAQLVTLCNSYPNCTPAVGVMNKNMTGLTTDGIHMNGLGAYQSLFASILPSL